MTSYFGSELSIFNFLKRSWHTKFKCYNISPQPYSWGRVKLVPSAIYTHPYICWIDIELMDKWHWRCPQQIRGENNVNHSFSLFSEGTDRTSCSCTLSVSLCVSCVVFLCVSECLLSMCKASVSLPSLWVRGLCQGQFTKSVGPRGRGWWRLAPAIGRAVSFVHRITLILIENRSSQGYSFSVWRHWF